MMRRVKRVLKSTLTPRIRRAGEERSDVVVGPDYGAVLTNVQDQQVVGNVSESMSQSFVRRITQVKQEDKQ